MSRDDGIDASQDRYARASSSGPAQRLFAPAFVAGQRMLARHFFCAAKSDHFISRSNFRASPGSA
jgi:hypothetical protein